MSNAYFIILLKTLEAVGLMLEGFFGIPASIDRPFSKCEGQVYQHTFDVTCFEKKYDT